ncbi:MAG: 3-methyl-2-oxobutanoate hydroxymethyltransferase [Armatimonadota bacterium]|nr:3-methyl-2-oxobutanoate hydroxymethyltransferase [Armatimonadota bacterium]
MSNPKVTAPGLIEMKARGEKITALTAYDYPTIRLLEQAEIDIALVGDSLGNVVLGYDTTLPVTMEEMLHHTKAVAYGADRALVVVDMPFLSYQISGEQALMNAGRFLKEGGAAAVKLEGGMEMAETVRRLVDVGIPVMGHLGMTPQSVHALGGYKLQGQTDEAVERIMQGAESLQNAGAFAIVLEMIPAHVARQVTESVDVPTIGIGAGPYCDGQVLVIHDMLGLYDKFTPKFVKQYAQLGNIAVDAIKQYAAEVKSGEFPGPEQSY